MGQRGSYLGVEFSFHGSGKLRVRDIVLLCKDHSQSAIKPGIKRIKLDVYVSSLFLLSLF